MHEDRAFQIRTAIEAFKDIVRDLPPDKRHTVRNILVLDALEDFEEMMSAAS